VHPPRKRSCSVVQGHSRGNDGLQVAAADDDVGRAGQLDAADYEAAAKQVAARQIMLAGYRLADVLNGAIVAP
jgi:hypothetical protein